MPTTAALWLNAASPYGHVAANENSRTEKGERNDERESIPAGLKEHIVDKQVASSALPAKPHRRSPLARNP